MDQQVFEDLFRSVEVGLRRALISWYGPTLGREAASEALVWAWEHQDRLETIENLPGYLFRVGQSVAKRELRHRKSWQLGEASTSPADPHFEPELVPALAALSSRQRAAVLMVHGYGYSYRDAARALNVSLGTVRTHVDRAMVRLRSQLEVDDA